MEAINAHDAEAIAELMTEDHRFIDSGGMIVDGRDAMREGWIGYFKMVPDYVVDVCEVFTSGDTVVLLGKACGTYSADGTVRPEDYWETPAAWKAIVAGERIALWQVFADSEPIGAIMRKYKPSHNA